MQVDLNINPEQVERHVAEAILRSSIGTHLKDALEKVIATLNDPYGGAIKKVVEQEVSRILTDLITVDYGDKLKAAVKEKITESTLQECVDASWKSFTEAMDKVRRGARY